MQREVTNQTGRVFGFLRDAGCGDPNLLTVGRRRTLVVVVVEIFTRRIGSNRLAERLAAVVRRDDVTVAIVERHIHVLTIRADRQKSVVGELERQIGRRCNVFFG